MNYLKLEAQMKPRIEEPLSAREYLDNHELCAFNTYKEGKTQNFWNEL